MELIKNNMNKFSSVYSYHYENNLPFDMSPHDECHVQLQRHNITDKLKFAFYGMDPWPEKNITQTECVRAIYKNPEYVEGSEFDINKLERFEGNPGRNQEVRRRFGVWGVPDIAQSPAFSCLTGLILKSFNEKRKSVFTSFKDQFSLKFEKIGTWFNENL